MAEGMKTFINNTDTDVLIYMLVRDGDSPADEASNWSGSVLVKANGGNEKVVYEGDPGSLGYVYLDGLMIEWKSGTDLIGVTQRVAQRGDAWDNVLNTNDTVTFSAVSAGSISATGSNS